jgi:hypothetical protein
LTLLHSTLQTMLAWLQWGGQWLLVASFLMVPTVSLAIATVLTLYHGIIIASAEKGRKLDLVRRNQVQGFDFDLLVLIPFSHQHQYLELIDCLACLEAQEYPAHLVRVLIVADASVEGYRLNFEALSTVYWVTSPVSMQQGQEQAGVLWATKQLLQQHSPHLFVFLNPCDLVKPDFLNQITARAYEHSVIQGYVANREFGAGVLPKVAGVLTRLASRIECAGRYHAGFGVMLRESGFAIKTSVLEKLTLNATPTVRYWGLSIALMAMGQNVVWAPNVVVFRRYYPQLGSFLNRTLEDTWFQAKQVATLLGSLLLLRPKVGLGATVQLVLALLPTNSLLVTTVALAGYALQAKGLLPLSPFELWQWALLACLPVGLTVLSLSVARLKLTDWVTAFALHPLVTAMLLVWTPFFVARQWLKPVARVLPFLAPWLGGGAMAPVVSSGVLPLFDKQPDPKPTIVERPRIRQSLPKVAEAVEGVNQQLMGVTALKPPQAQSVGALQGHDVLLGGAPSSSVSFPSFQLDSQYQLPLSFGNKQVTAQLQIETSLQGDKLGYQLVLSYRQHTFKTSTYALLDQAFYELQSKLMPYNIRLHTCGSCAFFHRPEASLAHVGLSEQCGVCLQGQQGQAIAPSQFKAVSVLSPSCSHHSPLEQRAQTVKAWRASLPV